MLKLLFILICLPAVLQAQQIDKDLMSLVNAERSFSKMSVDKNLREAFVHFFATNSVAIEGGKEMNGLEHAKQMRADSSLVVWEPNFADIASSKDFGYTTGPVRFYKSHSDTVPAGGIYYSTVWEKQSNGEWKVIFDLGSAKAETDPPALAFTKRPLSNIAVNVSTGSNLAGVLQLDKEYINKLNAKNGTSDPSYFSDEGRIHRPRTVPVKGKSAIEAYTDPKERSYVYKLLNGRIARSGDMAFTYGTVDITINSATPQTVAARYFRVWKKEKEGWKIVLDVLG